MAVLMARFVGDSEPRSAADILAGILADIEGNIETNAKADLEEWSSLYLRLQDLYDLLPRLSPNSSFQGDHEEPSIQQMSYLCGFVEDCEERVNEMSRLRWDIYVESLSEDLETLFANLRVIEILDELWWQLKNRLMNLMFAHEKVDEKAYYPTDRARALVQQLLRFLDHLQQMMDDTRSLLRDKFNTLSRPSLRPLKVVDLPDELLMTIFDFVKTPGSEHFDKHPLPHSFLKHADAASTRDIQNSRLTCRRFYATSTHLLINHVTLQLQPQSLSRLQEISRHPLIRQGVRYVQVRLDTYQSQLTRDLRTFADHWISRLQTQLHVFRTSLPHTYKSLHFWRDRKDLKELTYKELKNTIIRQTGDILEVWRLYVEDNTLIPEFEAWVAVLLSSYKIFKKRYEDQERLLGDGQLVQAFTDVLARLPAAKILTFTDHPCHDCFIAQDRWYQLINNPLKLAEDFLKPITPCHLFPLDLPSELPTNLILEILGALPEVKTAVQEIDIEIRGAANTSRLVPDPQTREKLSSLAKQLRKVHVEFQRDPLHIRAVITSAQIAENIYSFISPILDTESLQTIEICLKGVRIDQIALTPPNIGPILSCQRRPKLKFLLLAGMTIDGSDLQLMADSLRPGTATFDERVYIYLDRIHLLSGSWIKAANSLRAKANGALIFNALSGADMEDLDEEFLQELFKEYFSASPWELKM
ncbi:hypothetical protein F5Y03DRAFT_410648 [Xylaria venustula]|nr:hypothetical protein F5Y03DRAFT_410648 [Xylaria venustula]